MSIVPYFFQMTIVPYKDHVEIQNCKKTRLLRLGKSKLTIFHNPRFMRYFSGTPKSIVPYKSPVFVSYKCPILVPYSDLPVLSIPQNKCIGFAISQFRSDQSKERTAPVLFRDILTKALLLKSFFVLLLRAFSKFYIYCNFKIELKGSKNRIKCLMQNHGGFTLHGI